MLNKLFNKRTFSLIGWTAAAIVILLLMPSLDDLVREKGQVQLPESAQSVKAAEMARQMNESGNDSYGIVAVFNSGGVNPLTEEQRQSVDEAVNRLQDGQKQLGILEMWSHMDGEETAEQLVSADRTTILTRIAVDKSSATISEAADRLYAVIGTDDVSVYLTGNELVLENFVQSTQKGIQKTEMIAVVFILVILVLIFRSPIVPIISLLTVGVAYLVSIGIVAHLVNSFHYPFSNFTQVFLVVILFGIGTDYNILLFTRFKEELGRQADVTAAIRHTYKTAGRTVLYSGLAVCIGFLVLLLADFQVYRASSAVAIGVAILIAVLYTLNPFFMGLLGAKMFWPSRRLDGHGDNRLWALLSGKAVTRPFVSLLIVALLCAPLAISYSNSLSYNDLLEVDDSYASKQGIRVIEDHFTAGFSSPTTVVIQASEPMDTNESLQTLDELAQKITGVDGVAAVYAVTRPMGERIEELYIRDQASSLYSGLDEAAKGIDSIYAGLSSAEEKLNASDGGNWRDVQRLIDGTGTIREGAAALQDALQELSSGVEGGAAGASQLKDGLHTLTATVDTLSDATGQLMKGYEQLEAGLSPLGQSLSAIAQAIEGARAGYEQIELVMTDFVQRHPELSEDASLQTTLAIASTGKERLAELSKQMDIVLPQYEAAMSGFRQANASLGQVDGGLGHVKGGLRQLEEGAASLADGLREGAAGAAQIAGRSGGLDSGLAEVNEGQRQLLDGLHRMEDDLESLRAGLGASTAGLEQVSDGLSEAQRYIGELGGSESAMKFYIPQDVLEGEDFKRSLDMYMSDDRTIAQLTVMLDVNPYTVEAMDIVGTIGQQVSGALEGSHLSDARLAIGGKSSQNADLKNMAGGDFIRTAIMMLMGIGLVLIVITRSFWQPVFIVVSLLLACSVALGLTELIGQRVLGVEHLGWNVPFFSFIMIVALGVDYSIFFMMRYREQGSRSTTAIIDASRQIGGVVISAAIILGGTFAALIPSGILTLIEVAIAVILGLLILSFIMLPVLIPSLMTVSRKLSGASGNDE